MEPALVERRKDALCDPQARARLAEYFALLKEWTAKASSAGHPTGSADPAGGPVLRETTSSDNPR
jgi:hypothetical protein